MEEFFEQQDSRLLLGVELPASAFNDSTVARGMDALYEAGAGKVFSEVAYQAAQPSVGAHGTAMIPTTPRSGVAVQRSGPPSAVPAPTHLAHSFSQSTAFPVLLPAPPGSTVPHYTIPPAEPGKT
ncbi:MAG: DUF4277 domain-containing protein [Lentisphaeria bacterium]|nr:DUF4277 domain-containing protein [Lentisphaeria bacterium]